YEREMPTALVIVSASSTPVRSRRRCRRSLSSQRATVGEVGAIRLILPADELGSNSPPPLYDSAEPDAYRFAELEFPLALRILLFYLLMCPPSHCGRRRSIGRGGRHGVRRTQPDQSEGGDRI